MLKTHLPISILIFASAPSFCADVPKTLAPTNPVETRGVAVCSPGEKWEHGQDLTASVPAVVLQEFTATAKDRTAPLRGFSEGTMLRSEKSETARALGEYWMGRSMFLSELHGPAIQQFNVLIAQSPNAHTVPFQLAAMECLRNIHEKYPVPLLTNDAMAKLDAYYKPGLVSENARRPLYDMTMELVARRIADKSSADSVENAIKLLKGGGYYEDYARAIWAANRKKLEGATGALKRLADAKDLPRTLEGRKNEIRLLLARALYQDRKFKEASHYLDVIDKRSNAFVQALVLQSWVDLARNEHRRVVGTTIAFQSTGLRTTFAPEAHMTGGMALNEFCLFPEALRTLGYFKRAYGPAYNWLRNKAKSDLYPEAIAHLTKKPTSVPPQVASEWIRSPLFLNHQRAINGSFQQEKAINGLVRAAETFEAAEAARLEALRRKVAIREATEISKEAAKKSSSADFTAKDLGKKSVASVKALEEARRDAAQANAAADVAAKRASEAPVTSQKLAEESKVASKRAADADADFAAAKKAEAAAKASIAPAQFSEKLADDKASASERITRLLDLAAKEAERKKLLAYLPLRNGEAKAKKTAADAQALATRSEQAKAALATVEQDYAYAKTSATMAREEAKTAAWNLREALKKSGGSASSNADAAFDKAWDKARADKTAAEERIRRADMVKRSLEKRLVASEATVSRTALVAQSSDRAAASARYRATQAAGSKNFEAFEKALGVIAEANAAEARRQSDAKVATQAAEGHAALKAEAEASRQKLAEAEANAGEATEAIEKMKSNAGDARSARKIASTTDATAKKAEAAAKAVETKAIAARKLSAKLERDSAASSKLADAAQKTFSKASESVVPYEKRAIAARTEASLAEQDSRMARAVANEAKANVLKLEPFVQSRTKLVMSRGEASGKLGLLAQHAAKRAEEAKAHIAGAALAAKQATQKAADGKTKVQSAELASANAKKAAEAAKEKAAQAAVVAKELAKFMAAVVKAGGKAGAVVRPAFATLEAPTPEMTRLTEQLLHTEARQAQLKKSLAMWTTTLKQYKDGAPRHRERLMARIEANFKSLNERMLKQLEVVAKSNDLVEAEIWHGAGKDIVWQNANPGFAAAIKEGKFASRTSAGEGTYDWGSVTLSRNGRREVWEDEVGNASAALVDNCSNKEKYATLKKGN